MLTNDLVAQYLGECHLRGLARSTTEQYRWALTRLITHCPTPPRDGFDLLPVLGDNNLSPESRRDLLKCLRTFFGWCGRRHQLPNPCIGLEPIIRRRLLPRVLSRREVERLMAAALIERDRALLLVILDCGLRVGEVAGLMRDHIRDGWLVVDGKVGTRQVPVSDELCATLAVLGDREHIWTGKKGPLTRNGVVQAYQRMFGRAGITGPKAGPHCLRHTFATWYLRAGGGVRQLQDILGHSKIETTMIYVHLAGRDVQADHSRYSPARTMGWLNG